MPEYLAKIRSKKKEVKAIQTKIMASCHSDAEKTIKESLSKDQYIHSLDNISFGQEFRILKK